MIKFNMYNITDTETGLKVKVRYSHGTDIYEKVRSWVYEDGYTRQLHKLFDDATNDSDFQTDYHETSKVCFYEGHPHYNTVVEMADKVTESRKARKKRTA